MSEPHPFGYWLKRRRKALDLTQAALADQVGCSAATIRKLEDEERRPSAQIVERMAEIFEIPPDERAAFLRFARGDWQAAPKGETEDAPWHDSRPREQSEPSNPKTYLATFLFTDIEGSSKLWEEAPEKMKVALQRHHAILQEAIASNGGTVFQIVGDAFCAAFSTVLSGVSAAVTAQQELHQEHWDLPFPIRVRMGIHTGEAERISDNALFGGYASNQTLNRVARILNVAHGGQVLLSLATKDLVQDSLPANTKLRDLGEHHLKNLSHPEHLFQLDIAGLPSDFPPLNTLTHRHNLPIQLTSFIAREQEIALVHQYLLNDDIRLVTLIGPPGIGKTRLSMEAARRSFGDFPEGVFFVALAPLEDPALIPVTVAQALGYVETGNMSTDQQLKESIRDKKILIVLDNCEHLIEGVASLTSQLLFACSHLKILATSRESLRIPGEWLYPVPALDVPAFDVPGENLSVDIETASNFPALTLFAERARAVRPDFVLSADNIKTVSTICAHLDGLPLAIELIAARMRLMSPESLLAHLTDQFILSADGMRSVSVRQKTLNGAIHWSYKLLSAEEQNLFTYLSVFSGGFTLEAVETMFSESFEGTSVANLVTSLLDKSLLQRAVGARAEIRFHMLVTIQQFALNQLRNMGKETEARNRHLAYFLTLAEQADQQVHGPHQLEWINKLEAEHDNSRAAFEWSLSANQTENAVRLFNRIHWAWHLRGHFSEMSEWFEKIINLPEIEHFPLQHARALTNAASWEWLQGKLVEAHSHLTQSKSICMELGLEGEAELAWAFTWLSHILRMEGTDLVEAASLAKDALQLHQKWGDQTGDAFSTFFLGTAQTDQKLPSAKQTLEQTLKLYHQLGDSWGIARASQFLGVQSLNTGDLEKAQTYFEQHLFLDEQLDFKPGISAASDNLANIHRVRGDFIQARQSYQKSIQISQEYGLSFSYSLYGLSMTALAENDYESARKLFTELFYREGNQARKMVGCDFLMGLAAVSAGLDQLERSAKLYGAAQEIMDTTDYKYSPYDRTEFERHIQLARARLVETFESFVEEGRAMTMDQAIEYALEKSDV